MYDGGLVNTPNQLERARQFRIYAESALADPSVVGFHWFQYVDQPVIGRSYDGENSNVGLVDITDTPYKALCQACRDIGARLYGRARKATK